MMQSREREILILNDTSEVKEVKQTHDFYLEPALTAVFFGWMVSASIIPNQLLKQTCLSYGFNRSECSGLVEKTASKEIEEQIQPQVAQIIMVVALINSIIPAVLRVFIGPWSDIFGRKKVIMATFCGFSSALALFAGISNVSDHYLITPWIYLIAYIPVILTGGFPTLVVSSLCYTIDLASEANRSSRLALIHITMFIGILLGTASSSYILNLSNATNVFYLSTFGVLLASIYTAVFVEESVKVGNDLPMWYQVKELLSKKPITDMMETCFKFRLSNGTNILWCLIGIMTLNSFSVDGNASVFDLFVREQFRWTLKQTTLFESTASIFSIFGSFLGLSMLKKLCKISDISLAFFAVLSMLVEAVMVATAKTTSRMYLASGITLFKTLLTPMCRSLITMVTSKNEMGKIFSMVISLEGFAGSIAATFYSFVYSKSFKTYAGAFYWISVCDYLFILVLMFSVFRTIRPFSYHKRTTTAASDYETFPQP